MTEPADALPPYPALLGDGSRSLHYPLVSAHRAGLVPDRSGQDPRAALQGVLDAGCDLVELDVRRTSDGVPVVEHEDDVAVGGQLVPVGALTSADLARTEGGCLPLEELFPGGRLRRSDATLIVCQKDLARAWIARWARRRRLPLLVWTVDEPAELRRWLADSRTWAVTTDHPRTALALRGSTVQFGR